ncbi:MAG: 30S ribosomal protein S9 [Solirubrobacterales bacterium]|nr:30S ribosomal protein S9 [Solirubrobacterales bacterium]
MADDDKTLDETPENTEEAAEAADPAPVAEEQGENTAPDDEAAAEQGDEPAAEPVAEEAPGEEPDAAEEAVAEEAGEPEPEPEVESTEEAEPAEEEAAPEAEEELEPVEKKKDVIPGADLEPIAVEPEAKLSAEERARLEAEEEEKARREAALTGADDPDAEAASRAPAKMEAGSRFLATGKRKCSIARVTLLPGDGKIEVNKRSLEEFFPRPLHQTMATQPLTVSGYEGNVDVRVRVHGGGISGQAGAVRHGIAKALTEIDAELRGDLKRRGFLTRDARVKERRKAGFKKARKKPQFSKR